MKQRKQPSDRGTDSGVQPSTSRRGFLKGTAVATLGGAAALSGLGVKEASAQGLTWEREADVVVIGSGGAGLPAAIAARDQGVSVLIVEQNFDIGGMSINSGALVQLGCGNKFQKAAGHDDSPDKFFKDWTQKDHPLTRYNDRELVRKFADEAVPTFDFLTDNGVKWARMAQGTFQIPRTVQVAPWPNRNEQPTRGNNGGSGYARALEKSAKAKGVQFLMQHRMVKIHREKPDAGRVLGITAMEVDKLIQPLGRTVNIRARKGLIVATGGHTGNVNFRRMYDPRLTAEYSAHCGLCNPKNADGELLSMDIGASLWSTQLQTNEFTAQIQEGTSMGTYFNGGARFPPESEWFVRAKATGLMTKDYQDLILVKENGQRFWDETLTPNMEERRRAREQRLFMTPEKYRYYAAALDWTGDPKKLNGGGPIWAIFDQDAVEREGWKVTAPYVEENYAFKADTLEELAAKLSGNPHQWRPMPGKALKETVERYNSFVDRGVDGDCRKPTPLYKIATPPFYAAWDVPNPNDCYSGLRINANSQVLDTDGQVIPGLYAAGDSASGIALHGIGKASLFGRIAGLHAAKLTV